MTGTQNHEGIAGVAAAVDYLADVVPTCLISGAVPESDRPAASNPRWPGRHPGLRGDPGSPPASRAGRAAAFQGLGYRRPARARPACLRLDHGGRPLTRGHWPPNLAARTIYVWNGNMYALELTERLGLENKGGLLRIGLVHYNTAAEVDRLLRALDEL